MLLFHSFYKVEHLVRALVGIVLVLLWHLVIGLKIFAPELVNLKSALVYVKMDVALLKIRWTGMDLHKRAKCGIICISGIEKGYHNGKGQVQRRNETANRQVRA